MGMKSAEADLPSVLPMNKSIATNLVVYVMLVSNGLLGRWKTVDEAWGPESHAFRDMYDITQPLDMAKHFNLTSSNNFVSGARKTIVDYFDMTQNASTTDELSKIEFSHINLSTTVKVDALTIEIPTQKIVEQDKNSTLFRQNLTNCNPESCLLTNGELEKYTAYGSITTIYPRVQALAICLNAHGGEKVIAGFNYIAPNEFMQSCEQRSNSSMIVVSVGKRIEGDSFEANDAGEEPFGQLINARMVYSITVGRLSWESENLAHTYGAKCAINGSDCFGIRLPLERTDNSATNEHLLVSDKNILMGLLSPINLNAIWSNVSGTNRNILVSTVEETREAAVRNDTKTTLIVLPRNFKDVDPKSSTNMRNAGNNSCDCYADSYLNHIEKNHLYMEHTLQPAYTAGLYFLFQNAVVHTQQNSTHLFNFDGDTQEISIHASIPRISLKIAIIGCSFMVLGGVAIAVLGKRAEAAFHEHGTVFTVTEAIANQEKFPPLMLRLQLRELCTGELQDVPLGSLRIENMVLVNMADPNQQFVIGGNEFFSIQTPKTLEVSSELTELQGDRESQ